MICPQCHGQRTIGVRQVNSPTAPDAPGESASPLIPFPHALTIVVPCPTCGGSGIASCCDGGTGCGGDGRSYTSHSTGKIWYEQFCGGDAA